MLKFPICAFDKNIIFNTQGKAFALYKIKPQPYNFLTPDQKEVAVSIIEEILTSFTGKGQILLLWEELDMNANSYFQRNKGTTSNRNILEECSYTKAVKSAHNRGGGIHRYCLN